ncbi:hypothetical protein CI41S_39850 [Bradyrhizobium ivorense]|nr:hypothetical protein CI41S_39850 [Bradyrhizobium ivorense]
MTRCTTCNGHGEVVISITGDVRPPKLGEATTDDCPVCAGCGEAPGGGDELIAIDGITVAV